MLVNLKQSMCIRQVSAKHIAKLEDISENTILYILCGERVLWSFMVLVFSLNSHRGLNVALTIDCILKVNTILLN